MCGIAGILVNGSKHDSLSDIKKMLNSLRHRGPDDEGYAFFNCKGRKMWLYGGNDTPDEVYRSDLNYTPQKKITLLESRARFVVTPRGFEPGPRRRPLAEPRVQILIGCISRAAADAVDRQYGYKSPGRLTSPI